MSTNYPNSQDSYTIHQDNVGEDISGADVNNLQDAVRALETEVGYGTGQPTSSATANTLMKRDANGGSNVTYLSLSGLSGATNGGRFVGFNSSSGSPTTGTFAVNDVIFDSTGTQWVCTVAGTPGTWIVVGSKADAWHAPTLLNGWTNANNGNDYNAGYYKDANGFVWLRGNITSGTTSAFAAFFTLPVGYRPLSNAHGMGMTYNGTTWVSFPVYVLPNGNVQIDGGATVYSQGVLLDPIKFKAEQ